MTCVTHYSKRRSGVFGPPTYVAALFIALALLAGIIAPQNVFDPAAINVLDADLPPSAAHWFGTDSQGADVLSSVLYGLRISLTVAITSVILSSALGTLLGAAAGAAGGWVDAAVMRAADLQLAFPALLTALLIEGALAAAGGARGFGFWTVVMSLGLAYWAQYARAVRAATVAETTKDYILAAKMSGMPRGRILIRELMPNVIVSVIPIAAVNFAGAIVAEATLSFLGVGLPPSFPSLGTLIQMAGDSALSSPWALAFPASALALLAVTANLIGDDLTESSQ